MTHCTHKENLGGNNQPFIWSCKKGWIWVGKHCEKTCMYKETKMSRAYEDHEGNIRDSSAEYEERQCKYRYSVGERYYCRLAADWDANSNVCSKEYCAKYKPAKDKYIVALSKKQIERLIDDYEKFNFDNIDRKILKKLMGAIE